MQKTICKKVYDTETATLIKKVTVGFYGDPAGYEESLYQTESKYAKEDITRMSADRKDAWLKANA